MILQQLLQSWLLRRISQEIPMEQSALLSTKGIVSLRAKLSLKQRGQTKGTQHPRKIRIISCTWLPQQMRPNKTKSRATRSFQGMSSSALKKGKRRSTRISSIRRMIWTWRQELIHLIRTPGRPSRRTSTSLTVATLAQARVRTSRYFRCRPKINNYSPQWTSLALA